MFIKLFIKIKITEKAQIWFPGDVGNVEDGCRQEDEKRAEAGENRFRGRERQQGDFEEADSCHLKQTDADAALERGVSA